jgi:hypothetical protein
MADYPNLGAVITQADVSTKGTGSYAADYVNWCRVTHLLHDNAPGWQFALKAHEETGHVWKAPDGTAYVVGCFEHINGSDTPPFPQAIMDNRNNAILFEKVTARDLTDAHRRCLCTAAAAQFGLAWQLWAREPVENPHRDEAGKPALQQDTPKEEPSQVRDTQPKAKAKGEAKPEPKVVFLTEEQVDEVKAAVKAYEKREELITAFKKHFKIIAPRIADRIQFPEHKEFIDKYIAENP